jgi:hypothetical protein
LYNHIQNLGIYLPSTIREAQQQLAFFFGSIVTMLIIVGSRIAATGRWCNCARSILLRFRAMIETQGQLAFRQPIIDHVSIGELH